MRYERCKCGKATRFGSGMTYHGCEGCESCQTTFSGSPEGHKPLQPHKWIPVYDHYSGKQSGEECSACLINRKRSGAALGVTQE